MKTLKHILIACGSFKNVYAPHEACEVINDCLKQAWANSPLRDKSLETQIAPLADGGEYSQEVLSYYRSCTPRMCSGVVGPDGTICNKEYLILDSNTAFISSHETVHLDPKLENKKNPMFLTSYGFGQLIRDAVAHGAQNLLVGLGGTSTMDGGIGMAQAFGCTFHDQKGRKLNPMQGHYFCGQDMHRVHSIQVPANMQKKLRAVTVKALCDGDISIEDIDIPLGMKIGSRFSSQKPQIVEQMKADFIKLSEVLYPAFSTGRPHRQRLPIRKRPFYGSAGGLLIGLSVLFIPQTFYGVDFFLKESNLQDRLKRSDWVFTGEGKFDNSLCGKTPVGVSRLACTFHKPVTYVVGDIGYEFDHLFDENIATELPAKFKKNGISAMIRCFDSTDDKRTDIPQFNQNAWLRSSTPKRLKRGIEQFLEKVKI